MGHHLVGVYHGIPNNKTPDVDGSLLNVAGISTWLNLQPLVVIIYPLPRHQAALSRALSEPHWQLQHLQCIPSLLHPCPPARSFFLLCPAGHVPGQIPAPSSLVERTNLSAES